MINRRIFVKMSSVATAAALTHQTRASESLERLPEDNPQAQALNYVEDVEANPPDGFDPDSGQDCTNCQHYKAVDDEWGSCALFPGYKVRGKGWCSAWVAQQ